LCRSDGLRAQSAAAAAALPQPAASTTPALPQPAASTTPALPQPAASTTPALPQPAASTTPDLRPPTGQPATPQRRLDPPTTAANKPPAGTPALPPAASAAPDQRPPTGQPATPQRRLDPPTTAANKPPCTNKLKERRDSGELLGGSFHVDDPHSHRDPLLCYCMSMTVLSVAAGYYLRQWLVIRYYGVLRHNTGVVCRSPYDQERCGF
jgi:hypothetical protein